jgi:hypothetical protein
MKNQKVQIGILIGLLGISFIGCATVPSQKTSSNTHYVPGRLVEEPKPNSVFDRLHEANDRQTQYFKKGSSVTYTKVHGNDGVPLSLSPDERDILVLEGHPDYVRHFRIARGNQVDEWLYEQKDYQIQFKDGVLVYCSNIDQQAKAVLDYGQPTQVFVKQMAGGQQNELFWYKNENKMRAFSNGKLIVSQ